MEKKILDIKKRHSFDDSLVAGSANSAKLFGLNLSFFEHEEPASSREEEEKMLESEIKDSHQVNQMDFLNKLEES
jgi:hypothetical protein